MSVDALAGGTIFLEKMMINSFQWPTERFLVMKTAVVCKVDAITSLYAQVSTLTY
ncbi:hypothetical protein F511_17054 [Dorcoceras hygrometricum]|uniref:Uncharacterized protein n=1 Tax=Dorcoceras hygrometricum TaxID=472368 RepID=A0A2Z7CPQ6_9LAMI|nr:hypothetical protein F511_17054 [Dorcoceras hygrometricum]